MACGGHRAWTTKRWRLPSTSLSGSCPRRFLQVQGAREKFITGHSFGDEGAKNRFTLLLRANFRAKAKTKKMAVHECHCSHEARRSLHRIVARDHGFWTAQALATRCRRLSCWVEFMVVVGIWSTWERSNKMAHSDEPLLPKVITETPATT